VVAEVWAEGSPAWAHGRDRWRRVVLLARGHTSMTRCRTVRSKGVHSALERRGKASSAAAAMVVRWSGLERW
jgi:hypothetical protein